MDNKSKLFFVKLLGIICIVYIILSVCVIEKPWIYYLCGMDEVVYIDAQIEGIKLEYNPEGKSGTYQTTLSYTINQKDYIENIRSDIRDLSKKTIQIAIKNNNPDRVMRSQFVIPLLWEPELIRIFFFLIFLVLDIFIYKKIKGEMNDYKISVP